MHFMSAIDSLCPKCGLCCDGSLFADVELRSRDNSERLVQLGLVLTKKGRRKLAFAQPCACFDGKFCKIYDQRPGQCRLFECGVLKQVRAGKMTVDTALNLISEAKTLANRVRAHLSAFGQRPDEMPMTQCYSEAMSAPIDLSRDDDGERRGQLMQAYVDLMELLEQEFLR